MAVTVTARLMNNNSVGDDWELDFSVKTTREYKLKLSTKHTVYVSPGGLLKVNSKIRESDSIDDFTSKSGYKFISTSNIFQGFKLKYEIPVKENRGRYAGNTAYWEVTYTFAPAFKSTQSYTDSEYTSLLSKYLLLVHQIQLQVSFLC